MSGGRWGSGLLLLLGLVGRARADAVVVTVSADDGAGELAARIDDVLIGHQVVTEVNAWAHYAELRPVVPTEVDGALQRAKALMDSIYDARDGRTEEIAGFAYQLMDTVRAVEARPRWMESLGDRVEYAPQVILAACFEGVRYRAFSPERADELVEWCASQVQLVRRDVDVRPDVRPTLVRGLRTYSMALQALPAGEPVYVQGLPMREVERVRARPGAKLPVVADCGDGRWSRVRWVQMPEDSDRVDVAVDCALDAAVQQAERGRLVLASSPQRIRQHASELASLLDVQVLHVAATGQSWLLRLVDPNGGSKAATLGSTFSESELELALAALGLVAAPPTPEPSTNGWVIGGASAAGVGLAAWGASWALYGLRTNAAQRLDNAVGLASDRYEGWRARRLPMLWTAAGGAVALGVGLGALTVGLPAEGASWWSVTAGVAAAGLGAWGGVEVARGACDSVDGRGCVAADGQRDRGALLLAGAAALLSVPLVHVIKKVARVKVVTAAVNRGGVLLSGRW